MGCTFSAHAGDPGPFRLVFLDISEEPYQDGQKLLVDLRKMESLPDGKREYCFLCKDSSGSGSVDMLYLYSVPVGLSVEELRKAVKGDDTAKRKMQSVLSKFADQDGYGVDGLLIYDHQEGKVTIYTMDKKVGSKLETESKEVKSKLLYSSLDKLLEDAAAKLDRPV
ncbi:hypothetical protein HYN51_05180 [Limnobaculum parvum]|uniref:Uncharacterized protein n=1 Tax=Limnobaculum parvum TaxID=2172103 RepID=A0A2Y9U2C7_9GAMM|nr:hypothetical protein HYN51_05180 [Limnobaculum parvum]